MLPSQHQTLIAQQLTSLDTLFRWQGSGVLLPLPTQGFSPPQGTDRRTSGNETEDERLPLREKSSASRTTCRYLPKWWPITTAPG